MEAKKTHNLPSASWRPRGADGVIQSKSEGVIIGDSGVSTSLKLNVKENEFTLLSPFALFRPSTIWGMPTPTGEDNLLYLVYLFKCYSSPETPSPTYPEIMFYQLSGHPLDQPSWYIKLTITGETYSAFRGHDPFSLGRNLGSSTGALLMELNWQLPNGGLYDVGRDSRLVGSPSCMRCNESVPCYYVFISRNPKLSVKGGWTPHQI